MTEDAKQFERRVEMLREQLKGEQEADESRRENALREAYYAYQSLERGLFEEVEQALRLQEMAYKAGVLSSMPVDARFQTRKNGSGVLLPHGSISCVDAVCRVTCGSEVFYGEYEDAYAFDVACLAVGAEDFEELRDLLEKLREEWDVAKEEFLQAFDKAAPAPQD
jgi:hypothetical protein